ncbi:Annexin [Lachnellula occidentalis]|uniref:Annexin n=1 Tax=Lachnellula occidentalis TaxID=215460 RepID=A0A8H8UKE3_9HELO|nr:Annexin [Lachnellula occidentalis]
MSLDPRDSRTKGRSKSPGRRDSSRSRGGGEEREHSRVRAPSPPSSRYEYEEQRETKTTRGGREREPDIVTAEPRGLAYGATSQYRDHSPAPGARDRERERDPYAVPGGFKEEEEERRDVRYNDSRGGREKDYYKETTYSRDEVYKDEYGRPTSPPSRERYEYEREREREREKEKERDPRRYEDQHANRQRGGSFNVQAGHSSISGGISIGHDKHGRSPYEQPPSPSHAPPYVPPYGTSPPSKMSSYAEPKKWEYAQPDEKITYSRQDTTYGARPASPPQQYSSRDSKSKPRRDRERHDSDALAYGEDSSARSSKSQIVTVEPGARYRRDASPNPGLAPRMHSLSVSTGSHGGASMSLANAPGSPLLESYHGTYQSISPMPSPLLIASHSHSDVNLMEPLSPYASDEDRRGGKKGRRTARFHDPEEEATILAKALKGEKRHPDTQPLIDILPGLTHEQVLDLRVEYKRIVKTGSDKKGVNIAKHIKMRLKEEDSSLMKACYVCALGKWESEAYWANFWYQGEKSRRELLIESLMGRTNREIRQIKDGFSDKKYSDSLVKCMKTELKEDKFKKAVLLVLDERKMEERPGYGLDRDLLEDDVRDLYKAVRSEKGGESAMISIIVVRSDSHLKEVLRAYESTYRANFAREMLKKSGNLVGELLAHILNGVINKPVRDALLVHHALSLSKSDSIRTELLISRLVRYHWDRPHMEAVKREYRNRYGIEMQKAVAEGTRSDWGHFCEMLCLRRMGDEVREVRRVDEYSERRIERH